MHGGKDDRFWAGHYGVKMTLSSLKFDFSHVAGPYEGVFEPKSYDVSVAFRIRRRDKMCI